MVAIWAMQGQWKLVNIGPEGIKKLILNPRHVPSGGGLGAGKFCISLLLICSALVAVFRLCQSYSCLHTCAKHLCYNLWSIIPIVYMYEYASAPFCLKLWSGNHQIYRTSSIAPAIHRQQCSISNNVSCTCVPTSLPCATQSQLMWPTAQLQTAVMMLFVVYVSAIYIHLQLTRQRCLLNEQCYNLVAIVTLYSSLCFNNYLMKRHQCFGC